jgi:DNA polymerase III epsilon subunit-like protein
VSGSIVSLDLETTGLDSRVHRLWEIGIVSNDGEKMHYHVPPSNFVMAQPEALQISGFYDRFTWPEGADAHDLRSVHYRADSDNAPYDLVNKLEVAVGIGEVTAGATILGACPQFDTAFLATFLYEHGLAPAWKHRLLDLGSYCAGAWGVQEPLSTKTIEERYPNPDKHNAFADAAWNLEVYRGITGA